MIGLVTSAQILPIHYKNTYYLTLMLSAFFLSTLTTLQFRYTILICIFMLLAFNVSYPYSGMNNSPYYTWDLVSNNYILLGASALCLLTSYFNEMKSRKEFILSRLVNIKTKLLEYQSQVDGVTGLINRRHLDEIIISEWNRALRYHYPFAVLFADFDYFKQYNDIYGHQAGDKALNRVGLVFSTCINRAGDYIGRYGGDEFVAILSNTKLEESIEIAKHIMRRLRQLSIEHKGSNVSNTITITIGIAVVTPTGKNLQDSLIKQADLALQKGKMTKRGSIYIYADNGIDNIDY
jgi:diguanylate cyclase (GGDEF)-like protein